MSAPLSCCVVSALVVLYTEQSIHLETHLQTGEATWERPAPLSWRPIPTDEGHTYYHNDRTSDVQWEKPVDIAWEKAHFNPHVNILS